MQFRKHTNPRTAILTLGRAEKAIWQAKTSDGRDLYDARCAVAKRVRELHAAGYREVNVYAPACAGGWMVDQIFAD